MLKWKGQRKGQRKRQEEIWPCDDEDGMGTYLFDVGVVVVVIFLLSSRARVSGSTPRGVSARLVPLR